MSETLERQSTELIELPPQESALAIYSTAGGLDPLIQQIRDQVIGTIYDMSTTKGRDECRSDAAKVGRSKVAIEKLGKALSAEYKDIPKKIDAERRRAFDELEALQKEIRRPLTEWEEAEQARVDKLRAGVERIRDLSACLEGLDADRLRERLSAAEAEEIGEHWQEYESEAAYAHQATLVTLRTALAAREKYDADQAELARLRAEAEARAKKDEEDRIAREAAEAATKAAEAKAQAERDAAAKREADAKAAQERAEREKEEAIERQKQAEARAEAEKLAAEERAKQAAEAARQAEVKRQADEAARIEAEAKKREADRAHKAKVNGAALEAFIEGGMTEECAKQAITLIAKGQIPAIRIYY